MKTYLKQNINLFKVYFLGLLLFTIFRGIYLIRFGEQGIFSNFSYDIFLAFVAGFKFDTQILCYSFALIFILNFFLFIKNEKLRIIIIAFSKTYSIVILSILALLLFIDHQFYTYFQSHINILAYGFIEDDTSAVMSSMWKDHPIIKILASLAVIIFILFKVIGSIYSKPKELSISLNIFLNSGLTILFIGLFFLGVRGSVGIFPLQMDDSTVSENRFVNGLTLNGIYTLEKAIEERNESLAPDYKVDILSNSGYSSIKEVLADYYGLPIDSFPSENYLDYLFVSTKKDSLLEETPPNVIFILMESFGGYYLNFHSENMNLLGSFEKHMNEDLVFSNFLSSTQGTIYSLEHILMNKEFPPISGTKRRFESFNSSIAYPYTKAGYQTTFISGGKIGWRNLNDFLPNQYFKESYGQGKIIQKNPKASKNTWGVYDEFLFDEILKKLDSSPSSPKLICALTTTNHTPYEIPSDYSPYPLEIPDSIKNIILANNDVAELNFTSYQYANDCLGKFLTKLKASKHAANTIVAVTGDHNSYALFPIGNSVIKEEYNHIVPFYLYIPKDYKKNLHIDKNRYGSHKDIFPTLFNLSLSNQRYFSLGFDLFDEDKPDSLFYGINEKFSFSPPTLSKSELDKKVRAKQILSKYYYALP